MITKADLYLQAPYPSALIKSTQDYFQLKEEKSNLGRKKDDDYQARIKELGGKQQLLEDSLETGFGQFFRESALAGSKAPITTGVTQAIAMRKRKLEQYHFFNLCASGRGHFCIQEYLQDREEGRVHVETWLNLVSKRSAGNHSIPLCQVCGSYLNGIGELQAVVDHFVQYFDRVASLSAPDKQAFIEKLKEDIQPPRSFTDTTVQIKYRKLLTVQELQIIVRLERLNQVRKLASEKPFLEGLSLTDEDLQRFKHLCQKVSKYMVKKAQLIKTVDYMWEDRDGELVQVRVERDGDPDNNYNQPYSGTNSAQEVYHHLSNIMQHFDTLHTKTLQGDNEAGFFTGPLLAEECLLLSEMYASLSHMALQLKIPFSWDTHKAIHKHGKQIRTAEKALREDAHGYSLHKRIFHSGEVLWTVVKNGQSSPDIDQENDAHTGVYCRKLVV